MSAHPPTDSLAELSLREDRSDPPPGFSFFSRLPPELRAPIWRCLLPGPRIISFRNGHHVTNVPYCIATNTFDQALKSLLQTCQESRDIALTHYQYCFSANIGRPIWFSGSKDILHFYTLQAMDEFFTGSTEPIRAEIGTVRIVAVGTPPHMKQPNEAWARYFKPETMIPLAWMRFGGLTEIIMLQPAFSEEIFKQTIASLEKGVTKMDLAMANFTRSRDRFVVMRKQTIGVTDADKNLKINITTESFDEFWRRAV